VIAPSTAGLRSVHATATAPGVVPCRPATALSRAARASAEADAGDLHAGPAERGGLETRLLHVPSAGVKYIETELSVSITSRWPALFRRTRYRVRRCRRCGRSNSYVWRDVLADDEICGILGFEWLNSGRGGCPATRVRGVSLPKNRRTELPAGWRQPPETTAEPVPLLRPYAPVTGPLAGLLPPRPLPPRPRFSPRQPAGPAASAAGPLSGFRPRPAPPSVAPGGSSRHQAPPPAAPPGQPWRPGPPRAMPTGLFRRPDSSPARPARASRQHAAPPATQPGLPRRAAPSPANGAPANGAPARPAPPPSRQAVMRHWRPLRAIIGDETRVPVLWCESGDCIKRYASRDAAGDHDLRARAMAAGWRYDAFGRLACPTCAQHDPPPRNPRKSLFP
jgi:hypothetical protein